MRKQMHLLSLPQVKIKYTLNLFRQKLKLGIEAWYYLILNGMKDGVIFANGSWTKKFFKEAKFNRLYSDFYYNQVLTSHGVFGANQARLFGKERGYPCGEQLETIERILLKCKI
ncbi:hypothetical protein AVEN_89097-1 [Araneus ventricosus]|uniref:Uncharacterized protein n=1 Tax=Araneus ventricosus TaxID=182803 RepID=A0A4Y2B408_ARAVE|nr:hypothetical protein AVEN_89097-1 [Araneus ventricosus]